MLKKYILTPFKVGDVLYVLYIFAARKSENTLSEHTKHFVPLEFVTVAHIVISLGQSDTREGLIHHKLSLDTVRTAVI